MKHLHYLIVSFLFMLATESNIIASPISIVPIPMEVRERKGHFILKKETRILIDANNTELRKIAELLISKINISAHSDLQIGVYNSKIKARNTIVLTTVGANTEVGKEGYTLDVSKNAVYIRSITANGVFYGIQSLLQLLPPDALNSEEFHNEYKIPVVSIKDKPRFGYRGMHLDVGRHLFPVEFIKKYIDILAMYKINTFHWHLTDDQGWRIEIKKYPRLTEIGSLRKGTQIGKSDKTDSIPYGGYYTQDDAREIVAYAASKFVTVIPEIETPGHSIAALTAYPSISCTGGPFEVRTAWGVSDHICCAGNDSVFIFLQDVLSEIMDIFPSTYIHIGGDEAPKTQWKKCPKCQNRMKAEGLKNEAELQSYFIKRIEKFLVSKNRRLIGWDEILEGGLAPEATVMAWRGIQAAVDAATQGHDAILTPVDYCYFDYYQADPATEPLAIGGYLTLKTVYSYNPVPPELTSDQMKHIIGVQGNVWTEYMKTSDYVEYMAFPRAIAMAEIAWSMQDRRNWNDFITRMDKQFQRLDYLNVKYGKGSFAVDFAVERDKNQNLIVLNSEIKDMEIHFSTNGMDPLPTSTLYTQPFKIAESTVVKAALFNKGKIAGKINHREFNVNKASGKPVTIIKPYSFKYPGSGDHAMTDGLLGTNSYKSGWQGYEGTDMEFIVDLLQPIKISSVSLNFVKSPSDWVLFPYEVQYSFSADGKIWQNQQTFKYENNLVVVKEIKAAKIDFANTVVRFIKVSALSPKVLPDWHEYKGHPCWIFADELIVE